MPKKFENTFPREWATYDYYDPKVILPGLQKIRLDIQQSETPEKIRNLRTNTLKGEREAWDAALFCYLLSKTIGIDIFFSKLEASNYGSIFKWHANIKYVFCIPDLDKPLYIKWKLALKKQIKIISGF